MASTNSTLSQMLSSPFSDSSCSPPLNLNAVDKLQQTLESIDLSLTVTNHPGLNLFGYPIESNVLSGKYVVNMPNAHTIAEFAAAMLTSQLMGVIFATIIYQAIIKSKRREPSSIRVMIGLALIVSAFLSPYAVTSAFGIQNTQTRFAICAMSMLHLFRTIEAIFGFVPEGANASWAIYCTYFNLAMDMKFDPVTRKPLKATKHDILNSQIHLFKSVACFLLFCSILFPYGMKPFGETNAGEFHERIVLGDYLNAKHLGNCFAVALFFQQGLTVADAAIGSGVQTVLGYKADTFMRNPMLEATSPSDFWGRRWNVLVHIVLKRAVYKPVRKYASSLVASLAVFVASGLFHEWFVHAVFMYDRPRHLVSGVLLGSNTAFFVWNFVIIAFERILAGQKGIQSLAKLIPTMFIPFLIIMTSLPMAHWFGNPYLKGGFLADYEDFLPLIVKV